MKLFGCLLVLCISASISPARAQPRERVLDDFRDPAAWSVVASDQVRASAVRSASGGLCLRYDFGKVNGYAVLRRALPIELPAHYALALRLSGRGAANAFQFKLVDASGDNVWWMNRPDFTPPARPAELLIRQRQVEFAWGPTAQRTLSRAASVELVVARKDGGAGELCFDALTLRTLAAPAAPTPGVASASSASRIAGRAVDADAATAWVSSGGGKQQWQVDFGGRREFNGLMLQWQAGRRASDFDVEFSDDGKRWRSVRQVRGSQRDTLPLWLPDSETRHVRLALKRGPAPGYALAGFKPMDAAQWPTLNAMIASAARAAPRGHYPRAFVGEQPYWTVFGVDGGGASSALLSEDGALEPHRAGPSLEPVVIDADGKPVTWADVEITQSLRERYLPMPQVRWTTPHFALAIEAGADGTPERAQAIARYTLINTDPQPRVLTLALLLRPWQVNPPTQFLNTPGGVSPVRRLQWRGDTLTVNGQPWLTTPVAPDEVRVAGFEQVDGMALAMAASERGAALPKALVDAEGLGGAVLRWRVELSPGASRSIDVLLPLSGDAASGGAASGTAVSGTPASGSATSSASAPGKAAKDAKASSPAGRADAAAPDAATTASAEQRLDAIASQWRGRLNRVGLVLPPASQALHDGLRSALAQILVSRAGAALQPGTRSYARSWIRDGAMMVGSLLRMGEPEAARSFVQWYAGQLFMTGRVPCCVDARGADPVPENDSQGEFIHAVALLWQHTRDATLVASLWPQVDAAAHFMELLRQAERTPLNREPGREAFYGLLSPSISHEGYSAKPVHSYWDDFWGLAGYRDAVALARLLGHVERAAELARQRDEFEADLVASLAATVARHKIDHLPGAAELGDFDPSASTLIFSPAGAENRVPRPLLDATWDRYWRDIEARRDGKTPWADYTPYELRSVSAYVRLGQPERAHALLAFMLAGQRPAAWNQWAEVVGRLPREPRFIGDMPHAWISSDFIHSALDLMAYERPSDDALVLAAGVPASWWQATPLAVQGLRTRHGPLSYRLEREGPETLRLVVQKGLEPVPGGLWFAWAGPGAPPATTTDGQALSWQGRMLRLDDGGVDMRLRLVP